MTQKDYTEIIEDALAKYYSGELETLDERIKIYGKAIKYCRLFKKEHHKDYKHKFYGKWITMGEQVLEGMDKIIEQAKSYEQQTNKFL